MTNFSKLSNSSWKEQANRYIKLEETADWQRWTDYPCLYYEKLLPLVFDLGKRARKSYPEEGKEIIYTKVSNQGLFLIGLSPVILFFVVPFSILIRSSMNSVNKKTKLTQEMEKEAREVQKEIEDIFSTF